MRLVDLAKWIFTFTALALVYIHMQMQIIDLAYRTNVKEKQIRKLIEVNSSINSAILTLKSSNSLGIKMLADNKKMEFVGSKNIVQVSPRSKQAVPARQTLSTPKRKNPLLSLLSVGAEAEAKTRE